MNNDSSSCFCNCQADVGIDELHTGQHILRNIDRCRIGELTVLQIWYAMVIPTFHDRGVVAVVRTQDTEFRRDMCSGLIFSVVFFAVVSQSLVAILLRSNRLLFLILRMIHCNSVVHSVDIFAPNDSIWWGNLGYELYTDSGCRASFLFNNPTVPSLNKIEKSLFMVAKEVAETAKDSTF